MLISPDNIDTFEKRKKGVYESFFKRILDIIFIVLLFPVILVILLVISPIIYFQDKGPIFYNAPRLGKNGKIFKMYKFRSMKVDAPDLRNDDGSTFNSDQDPRVTKIGSFLRKSSLDEVPQLLNILKGDMSLIGPRPDLPEHLEMYEGNESEKLQVRPGVTGYNQAYFRNSISWKERIINDIYYIDNLSVLMDIKILFKTFSSVILKKGVFVENDTESE